MAKPHPYMSPNTFFNCEVCGTPNERYLAPSTLKKCPPRFCNRTCAGVWRIGANHGKWKGGRWVSKDGYIYLRQRNHPHGNHQGYVMEHRLVMEAHIGRHLDPEEIVHHEDEHPSNNALENLRLFANQSEHKKHHEAHRTRDAYGRYQPRN